MKKIIKKSLIYFFISMLVFITTCENGATWRNFIIKDMQIENAYYRPSLAYGPGTVVLYTKNSGYTRICRAKYITTKKPSKKEKEKYKRYKEDKKKYREDEYKKKLVKIDLTSIGVKQSGKKSFNIELNASEKTKVSLTYKDISTIELSLSNGKQVEMDLSSKEKQKLRKKVKTGNCSKEVKSILEAHPDGIPYIAWTVYRYDIKYKINTKSGTSFTAAIPKSVLKVIAAKLEMSNENINEITMKGKNVYVGFNR